jgi:hypothetical protein
MLKKLASGVLASLRGSTLSKLRRSDTREGLFRLPKLLRRANGSTKCGPYLLASSLVAALLDNLFEHPEANVTSALFSRFQQSLRYKPSFSGAC